MSLETRPFDGRPATDRRGRRPAVSVRPAHSASLLRDEAAWESLSPLQRLDDVHERQLRLCDVLERIADELPRPPSRVACLRLLQILKVDMPQHHADEEDGLFPLLRARAEPADRIDPVLDRLTAEHVEDEAMLPEILETLQALADDVGPGREPDLAGYVLRGFFESQRRHVAWETAVVMPLARLRLTEEDRDTLDAVMRRNRDRQGTTPILFLASDGLD